MQGIETHMREVESLDDVLVTDETAYSNPSSLVKSMSTVILVCAMPREYDSLPRGESCAQQISSTWTILLPVCVASAGHELKEEGFTLAVPGEPALLGGAPRIRVHAQPWDRKPMLSSCSI